MLNLTVPYSLTHNLLLYTICFDSMSLKGYSSKKEITPCQRSALMCNCIVERFSIARPEIESKNLSSPTFFEQSPSNFQDMF